MNKWKGDGAKPDAPGVYLIRKTNSQHNERWYCYFNGAYWSKLVEQQADAIDDGFPARSHGMNFLYEYYEWRIIPTGPFCKHCDKDVDDHTWRGDCIQGSGPLWTLLGTKYQPA